MTQYHSRKLTTTENTVALLWVFAIEHWTKIILYGFIIFLLLRMTVHILNTYLNHFFKWILQIKKLLETTKEVLEKPYEEFLWNDYEFCKRYLDLYAKFRELRLAAKKSNSNALDVNAMEFIRFDDVKLCRRIKNNEENREKETCSEEEESEEDEEESE
ncbi:Hypothetical protein SRAE_2000358100 [Strongyloides ratti]|uniref:Uncharacterized protein n=1 Tax=Strongyloides ratti TaxID=34506 RepID=A0A090LGM3_STRRB|nr:Hypothetical protein SRAE_2000358100 [Strongyloides ratti]CEF68927.1 Hypothetical protein SRAE_2000358100 [Strongyloides ratti]